MDLKELGLREIRKEEVQEDDYIYIVSENELFKLHKFTDGYNCSNIDNGEWSESENENVSLEEHLNGWEKTWDYEGGVKFYTKRKMKQIDKIRNMDIDELATYLYDITDCATCPHEFCLNGDSCEKAMKRYLNQEVGE